MQSLFKTQSARPVPLNVVREPGTSTFYFALPTTLRLGEVEAVMQCCKECSERHGAQFQGMVTEEIASQEKSQPHYAARVLVWRRHEKEVVAGLQAILQQALYVPVVPTYRQ